MDKETREMFGLVLDKLEGMEKKQEGMEKSLESMRKRQENMEKRQDEIFEVVKAIEHSNNSRKAETDNLTHRIAHVEGTVNGVAEFIQERRAQ